MTILLLLQYVIVTMLAIWLGAALLQRLQLSLAKSPGLGGHLRWAKRFAKVIRGYSYSDKQWLEIDGAPTQIIEKRQSAFNQLSQDA